MNNKKTMVLMMNGDKNIYHYHNYEIFRTLPIDNSIYAAAMGDCTLSEAIEYLNKWDNIRTHKNNGGER